MNSSGMGNFACEASAEDLVGKTEETVAKGKPCLQATVLPILHDKSSTAALLPSTYSMDTGVTSQIFHSDMKRHNIPV